MNILPSTQVTPQQLTAAMYANLNWFQHSGVMMPADGSWGVAERLAVTTDNVVLEEIHRNFQACTPHLDHWVVEQRRSDCCFQTAYWFLLAAEISGRSKYRRIAENLLDFLYWKSGFLNHSNNDYPIGVWNWSNGRWCGVFWFDDNGWVAVLELLIGQRYPELDRRYAMTKWGLQLARLLADALTRCHNDTGKYRIDPTDKFNGTPGYPHWGVPPLLALAAAAQLTGETKFRTAAMSYLDYLTTHQDEFNISETAYALLGAAGAQAVWPELRLAADFAARLRAIMAANDGILSAEHDEAPRGIRLLDLIYTVNWALLGFQTLATLSGESADHATTQQLLALMLAIQGNEPEPHFHGCWRGMYDVDAHRWGGGDCYEGGASSIYTGWTNAPIGFAIAGSLLQRVVIMPK